MKKESWESLCHGCGLCCLEKTVTPEVVIFHKDKPCTYLHPETNRCSCYNQRFTTNSRCLKVTWWRAMFSSLLPSSCGYVQFMRRRKLRWARKSTIIEQNH